MDIPDYSKKTDGLSGFEAQEFAVSSNSSNKFGTEPALEPDPIENNGLVLDKVQSIKIGPPISLEEERKNVLKDKQINGPALISEILSNVEKAGSRSVSENFEQNILSSAKDLIGTLIKGTDIPFVSDVSKFEEQLKSTASSNNAEKLSKILALFNSSMNDFDVKAEIKDKNFILRVGEKADRVSKEYYFDLKTGKFIDGLVTERFSYGKYFMDGPATPDHVVTYKLSEKMQALDEKPSIQREFLSVGDHIYRQAIRLQKARQK